MLKYIGQHIVDLIARFRSDVYLENLIEQEEEYTVMVAADGQLVKSTHPGERSRLQVRNDEGSTIPAGAPLYSKGEISGSERIKVGIADANDTAKMPCIGIAEFEMNTSDTKDSFAITQGVYNTNISGFTGLSEGDILYVDDSGSAPYLTQNKSDIAGSGSAIQNVGIVLKTNGTICQGLLVSAIGRSNDIPNLDNNNIFIGNASNQTTTSALSSINISSFNNDSGFTSNTGDITSVSLRADDSNTSGVTSGDAALIIAGGEGIDTSSDSSATITISGEDASTSNKGVASFDSGNFSVLSGAVSIKSGGVDLASEVTGTLPVGNGGTGVTSLSSIYSYQYLTWEVNTNSFTGTNYELPAANGGFGSDTYTTNSGVARNTAIDGSVTISLAANNQQQGWYVPHACELVGVSGMFRNNGSEVNPRDVAVFVGTPDIGSTNSSTYTQRAFAAGDDDGGQSNSRPYTTNVTLATPYSLSAGNVVMPAVCNSTGSSTVSMQGNFSIIIRTAILT